MIGDSKLSKFEKEFLNRLTSLFTYELTKGPLTHRFIELPEVAFKETSMTEFKKTGVWYSDIDSHDPYLILRSLKQAAKKVKHPAPGRLNDEFVAIALVDLKSQVDKLVNEVIQRYLELNKSKELDNTLRLEDYDNVLPAYINSEVTPWAGKPERTYFKYNPLLQVSSRPSTWSWKGWIDPHETPQEIMLLMKLCDDGWTLTRQLKIILQTHDSTNSLFELDESD